MTTPIRSKSDMKRVAAMDPNAAAEELMRLRSENKRLQYMVDMSARDLAKIAEQHELLKVAHNALEACAITVWISKYSGDVEWVRLNVQGVARDALAKLSIAK